MMMPNAEEDKELHVRGSRLDLPRPVNCSSTWLSPTGQEARPIILALLGGPPCHFHSAASAAEGAIFEVITAPQEQPDQAHEERRENPAQGPSDPSSEQQPQGKARCTSY